LRTILKIEQKTLPQKRRDDNTFARKKRRIGNFTFISEISIHKISGIQKFPTLKFSRSDSFQDCFAEKNFCDHIILKIILY